MPDLTQADFDVAFAFTRGDPASYRDSLGAVQTVPPDVPCFDHDAAGTPTGLLVGPGNFFGGGDRVNIDPLMLPEALVSPGDPGAREATVFHCFDAGSGIQRRAWYSRNAAATVDALLRQLGHHYAIGVIAGFRAPVQASSAADKEATIRYRGQEWLLPPLLLVRSAGVEHLLAGADDTPLIACGAEL